MATRTTDLPVAYRGVPTPFPVKVTSAETWYSGSMIFQLAAGGCTKTWAASLAFMGFSPYQQVIAAGGIGLVYLGPYIAMVPDTTAGLAVGDEADQIAMGTAGDNWLDVVKAPQSVSTATFSLIGRLLRWVSVTEVYIAVKSADVYGVSASYGTTSFLL
jgi:hypothetical protein